MARARPGRCDYPRQAYRELETLLVDAEIKPEAPKWVVVRPERPELYAWLTGDLVLPLERQTDGTYVAVSLFARAAVGEAERAARKRQRQLRRSRVRTPKTIMRGRPRIEPELDGW